MESRIDLDVIAAIHSGSVSVKRRLEIYESDGQTLWMPTATVPRMVDGSVTVDYGRDERRALDVTLNNSDQVLNHDPDGFWYDKVLKVYRGLEFRNTKLTPSILVMKDDTTFTGSIMPLLRRMGFTDITNRSDQANSLTLDDFYGYDIIVFNAAHSSANAANSVLLKSAYAAGFNILSVGDDTDMNDLPFVTATVPKSDSAEWLLNHPSYDTPMAYGWTDGGTGQTGPGVVPSALTSTARAAAVWSYASTTTYPAIYDQNPNGARWFHYQPMLPLGTGSTGYARASGLLEQAVKWLYSYSDTRSYEFQVGEFCIDTIDQDNFPSLMRVTGRDYVKRLLNSKFEQTVAFAAGTSVDQLVGAVAANGGIRKMLLGAEGAQLTADISFERGTERWKAIKDVCTASGVEVFFDRQGYLVTRTFLDPTTAPVAVVLKTGSDGGNLVSYNKRSSDARVKNIVIVTSENQDDLGAGFVWFGRSENTESSSPTRTERLGDRHDFVKTSLLRSHEACKALADQRLKISALEEFDLNFSSLVYPWLEVGVVAGFEDPNPGRGEPDRYLLSTLSIPMKLGPMSGTGKRITIVGSGSTPGDVLQTLSEAGA